MMSEDRRVNELAADFLGAVEAFTERHPEATWSQVFDALDLAYDNLVSLAGDGDDEGVEK